MQVTITFDPESLTSVEAATTALARFVLARFVGEEKPAAKKEKAASKKETPEPEPDDLDGPTRDEVRDMLKDCSKRDGKEQALAILKAHGAKSVKELKADKFNEVIEACKEAAKTKDEPSGPTRNDVLKALKEYAVLEGREAGVAILKAHNSASINELDESEFANVIAACGE